ncbi:MAG: hypothetical protein IJS28_06900 [Synergistaceae bacterium]|nr:hypothetical protein [Synergistaceae bacterium]
MIFSLFSLAGYGEAGVFSSRSIRLFNEHTRDELQFEHYADDWDEEDDANGWRQGR